jgi:hypothetical protein
LALGFDDGLGRDAVVRDVEEAGVFGGVADLQGEGSAGGEVGLVDGGEVDEGDFGGLGFARWSSGDGAIDGLWDVLDFWYVGGWVDGYGVRRGRCGVRAW